MPTKPAIVGMLRGALEAAIVAAIGVVAVWVSGLDAGEWNVVFPVATLALRSLEGFVDQKVDPTEQRGRLGGTNLVQ